MIDSIGDFVVALRRADVAVSPAETLDAISAMELIGPGNRQLLHDTLALILAKSPAEKAQFDICFDRFFSFDYFNQTSAMSGTGRDMFVMEGRSPGDGPLSANQAERRSAEVRESAATLQPPAHHVSPLGHLLLARDANALAVEMTRAARAVQLDRMRALRERSLFTRRMLLHMGLPLLEEETTRLAARDDQRSQATADALTRAVQFLNEEVRQFVNARYELMVDGRGGQFIADAASNAHLTSMQPYYFDHIRETVQKLAARLAKRHARRRRVINRGQLDIRRTLRSNLQYDGALFDLKWKQTRVDRPRVFVACDVSGSVRVVSRFLLTFLYSLGDVLPQVRSFAFSDSLGEVTDIFSTVTLADAVEMSLEDYGRGSTDYGGAFSRLAELALDDIDNRSTVIIMGDSRNNHYEPGVDALKKIAGKARQVIWLNPEPRERWSEGDAEMERYLPFCDIAETCNSLADLDRMVSRVLARAH